MDADTFAGAGEMGDLVAALDWARTPIGPMATWSNSLRAAVGICLRSRFPIVLWWGPELTVIYNDAYLSVAGSKHPRILGAAGREAWAEIWETIGPRLQRVLDRGEASWSDDELLLIRRHDFLEEGYFTFSYSPIADDDGSIGGVFCAVTETTGKVIGARRLRTLRDLAAASVRPHTIEEACGLVSAVMAENHADLPFALLYLADERAGTATLMGKTAEWLDPEAAPPAVDLHAAGARWGLARLWESGEAIELQDLRWPAPPGVERVPTTALVLPVIPAGGRAPAGMLVAGISPLRPLDDEYRSFLHLLTGQVATTFAAARAQEAERRRIEALAELDRSKTAFFSNVSHEFRTPLTLILGPLAALAGDASLSPEQQGQAEMARRNALRLLRLTNALLDFSRLQAGRLTARFGPTDLAAATAGLASSFALVMEEAGLEFDVVCPDLPTVAHVDPHMWETVVLNLISNAFKYTHEGRITVAVRDGGDHAELIVRDTGIGIPDEHLTRVFERFHRVPETRARSQEGAGIGLSLVEEIVRLHGGGISVVSRVGEGTAFTVSIPYAPSHPLSGPAGPGERTAALGAEPYVAEALRWLPSSSPAVAADQAPSPVSAGEGSVPGAGGRVLVVDDNADMRDHLRRILEPRWSVEVATNGSEALASARRDPPDAVLTDVMMPLLDGVGLLHSLRAEPRTALVPVVMLSARAGEEAVVEGLEAGADDYVPKPFSATEVRARLAAVVELSRARRARAAADARVAAASQALERAVTALAAVGDVLGSALEDPPSFFSTVTRTIAGLVGARIAAFWEVDEGQTLRLAGGGVQGIPAEVAARLPRVSCHPDGSDPAGRILYQGRVFRARAADAGPEVAAHREVLDALGARDVAAVPWTAGAEKLGLLTAYDAAAPGGFSDEDIWVLQIASRGAGLVWRCARAEAQRRAEQREEAARLQQHGERMSELERVKSDFLNLAAHELRGPITIARGYLSLLRDGSLPAAPHPRGADALAIVAEKLTAMSDLVDQMLDTARLEDPTLQLATQDIELNRFIDEIAVAFGRTLPPTHRLAISAPPSGLFVRGDRQRLSTLLVNLLDNAVKFSPEGGEVLISCASTPDGRVLISVQDQGIGIAEADFPLLFTRFGRVPDLRTNGIPGIGLGLYFARQIARLHGGDLRARSSSGGGSVFTVDLPLGGGASAMLTRAPLTSGAPDRAPGPDPAAVLADPASEPAAS